jgi:hypothetical protein
MFCLLNSELWLQSYGHSCEQGPECWLISWVSGAATYTQFEGGGLKACIQKPHLMLQSTFVHHNTSFQHLFKHAQLMALTNTVEIPCQQHTGADAFTS